MLNGNFIALQAVPSDVTLNFQNTGAYSEKNELVTLNPSGQLRPYESVHMTGIYFDKPATVNTTSITTGETGISAGAWTRGSQSASPPVSNLDFTTDDLNARPVVAGTDQLPGYRLQGDRGVNVVANRCFVTNPYVAEGTSRCWHSYCRASWQLNPLRQPTPSRDRQRDCLWRTAAPKTIRYPPMAISGTHGCPPSVADLPSDNRWKHLRGGTVRQVPLHNRQKTLAHRQLDEGLGSRSWRHINTGQIPLVRFSGADTGYGNCAFWPAGFGFVIVMASPTE